MRKITGKNRLADRRSALIQYYQGQVTLVIPAMLAEYKKRWCPYIEQRGAFKKLLQSMEESNANYPFGYMTNYYFRNFEHPTAPFYNGWFEFDKKNYHLLSEDEMKDLERKFKVDEITAEVKKSTQEIRDYVDGVVAKNAPIMRLKGMGEFYSELVAIRDEPWFCSKDFAGAMRPKGDFVTSVEAHVLMGLRMPFHRKLYVKLEPMYETFDILETKLKRLKTVLDSVSSDLAFSEFRGSASEELTTDQVKLPQDTAELANFLFDKTKFHPEIIKASESLFKSHHYAQAIFEAFKAVNNFVKEKTGLSLDGKDLMAKVFREDDPIIKLNELKTRSERDEEEGFKFLFMGAMVGIRNPKAHDNVLQTDPYRTLEYLSFASLLMKRAEEGKTKRPRKNVKNQ